MSEQEIQSWYDFVLPVIKDAGKVMASAKKIDIEYKTAIWDLVTIYDRKVEEILFEALKKQFPNHSFMGEEDSASKNEALVLTDNPTWIIDPIDGTTNFVRRFPIACISVGLAYKKEVVLGIIYNPFMDELYAAIKGKGSYMNGEKLKTSNQKEIRKSVLNYELSLATMSETSRKSHANRYSKLMTVLSSIRSMGCAALGLCYVANGTMDAYQADGLYPWDSAAGSIILREAGGYICNTNNPEKPYDVMNGHFLGAATKELAEQILKVLKEADESEAAKDVCQIK